MSNPDKKKKKLMDRLAQLEKEQADTLKKKENGAAEKFLDFQRKIDKLREELNYATSSRKSR